MPELPEVETIRRDIEPRLRGRTIAGVRVYWERTISGMTPAEFKARVVGQTVRQVDRRGKYLLIRLESGASIGVHLRMTGRLGVAPGRGQAEVPHLRAAIDLDNGRQLFFADMRKFGRLYWLNPGDETLVAKLGPEPLDGLTLGQFAEIVRHPRQIKSILLDQSNLAGIGNIYADESLHRAGIHPSRKGDELAPDEVARLFTVLVNVLESSIAARGTTYRDYVDGRGRPGEFQEQLGVYGRKGRPCPRCGGEIRREVVANRGTYICPHCQPGAPDGPDRANRN